MILPVLATAVCIVATAALLVAERGLAAGREEMQIWRRRAKLIAAAGFVAVALSSAAAWSYGSWIAAAMIFGLLGDAALLGSKRRAFVAGMVLFALDHACVLRAAAMVVEPRDWPLAWGLVPAVIGAAAVVMLWPNLGLLRVPVALYTALIAAMVTAASAPFLVGAPAWFGERRAALLAAGALCFFLSDLAVARQRFAHESFWNKAFGLPLYFGGQLLIAWSAFAG